MNCFVLTNRQRSAKTKEKNLQSFLDVAKTKYVESSYEVEGPNYWLVMTLLLWSKENWNQNKIKLLERLLILTQVNCLLYCYIILCYIIMAYDIDLNTCEKIIIMTTCHIYVLLLFACFAGKLSKI